MSAADDDFLRELRATFEVEAREHLEAIASGLLEIEGAPSSEARGPIVERIFRAAHSLKGAARAVDLTAAEAHCQSLEDTFAAWKRQPGPVSRSALDTAHRLLDGIASVTSVPASPGRAVARPEPPLAGIAPSPPPNPGEVAPVERLSGETVRIAVAKLDARLVEAEEMLTAKLSVGQRADDLREVVKRLDLWRKEWSAVEPGARALRRKLERTAAPAGERAAPEQARILEFLDWNLDYIRVLENQLVALARTAQQDRHVIGKLVDDLLEDSKKLLLLPFATIVGGFPKLVRDLCREQGKKADLVIRGDDVEIDKRTLEEMKDPLIHLLRNCLTHGLELPEQRVRQGKPARGTITLAVSRVNGSKVELRVSDDGAGVNLERVREAVVRRGLLSPDEARQLGDAETRALIFQSEVTTSPMITRLAGRGLGLAIVKESAEKLGGAVSVESEPGQGTTFRLLLPAMRATFRGILVEVAKRLFVVPTGQVERATRVKPADIQTVEGRETVSVAGMAVAYVRLADVLALPQTQPESEGALGQAGPAIVLGTGDQRMAFAVDAVLDEQEVLVKPLRKPLVRVRNIAGVTVLGSGQVVPILHVADLLKAARQAGGIPVRTPAEKKIAATRTASILVAEDSITSRMLLKNILESAGYMVKTAVDGAEAFALLRTEHFDLVVSDVEMPRLNGFDLTARIRADKELADLPVILVTALETREDREKGVDVGANAYLVKSNFNQSNLIEAVRRLI